MNKGFEYEQTVAKACREAAKQIPGLGVARGTAGSNHGADVTLNLGRKKLPIEVKYDLRAPMGQCRVSYDLRAHSFKFSDDSKATSPLDDFTKELILKGVEDKEDDLVRFLNFLRSHDAWNEDHIKGTPFVCKSESWEAAQRAGLLTRLAKTVTYNSKIISDHYRAKGVTYMQIGKAGLFYLWDNPLDLPIPQLKGDVSIEIRMKSGGKKKRKDFYVTDGSLSASARFLNRSAKSDYSLDRPADVMKLLQNPSLFGQPKKEETETLSYH